MRCAYCHDDVGRGGGVACAAACGATYHAACWDEHRAAAGRCAIPGCASTETRAFGALGRLSRVLRLLVAALLFGRRAAARVVTVGAEAERESESQLAFLGRWAEVPRKSGPAHPVQKLALGIAACAWVALLVVFLPRVSGGLTDLALEALAALIFCVWASVLSLGLLHLLVFLPVVHLGVRAWNLLRGFLRREVTALERQGVPRPLDPKRADP
jgi:hypothetical protein